MKINQAGLELIKSHEGCRLTAYRCPAGVLTIAYGHTGADVHEGDSITMGRAEDLLREDLRKFEDGVDQLLVEVATSNQFSALVSFAFNVGLGNLRTSTLLRKFNQGDMHGAADEFLKWTKASGKVLPGLVMRRRDERDLFLS